MVRNEFELALTRLEKVKRVGNEYMAQCPCHSDLHQSLSVKDAEGKALMYCHAGCKYEDIIAKLGLKSNIDNAIPKIVATYDYTGIDGRLLYQVVRYQPKNFRQRRPDGKGGWLWNLNGLSPILYHLPEVVNAIKENNPIFCVEGEKDVETLRQYNQIATTISGGSSSSWTPEVITYFYHSRVVIIPDNDKAGKDYAKGIASNLYGWCASLKVIALPIDIKGDVTDYLEAHTIEQLLRIVNNTPEYTPIGAVTRDEYNNLKGHLIYLNGRLNEMRASAPKRKDII